MFWSTRFSNFLTDIVKVLRDQLTVSRAILKVLRLRTPGLVFLRIVREDGTMLGFVLTLPTAGAADVVGRELTVSVGGAEPSTETLAGDTTESSELSGEQDQEVTGTLVDIDDAGNRSEARPFSFVLTDTLPPPMPGEVGLVVKSES